MQISDLPGVTDLQPAELLDVQGGDGDLQGDPTYEDAPPDWAWWQFINGVWRLVTSPPPTLIG